MSDLFKDPVEEASRLGLKCVLPKEDELFVDLDDEDNREQLEAMLDVLNENGFHFNIFKETESKSGNVHVYVKTDLPITDTERVAFQACLGSDPKRELLSLLRIILPRCEGIDERLRTKRHPTTFFEVE